MKYFNQPAKGGNIRIVEKASGYYLFEGSKTKIRKMMTNLNMGGGFNGNTPKFFAMQN